MDTCEERIWLCAINTEQMWVCTMNHIAEFGYALQATVQNHIHAPFLAPWYAVYSSAIHYYDTHRYAIGLLQSIYIPFHVQLQ
jgi:hypothetical protein